MDPQLLNSLPEEDKTKMVAMIETMQTRDRWVEFVCVCNDYEDCACEFIFSFVPPSFFFPLFFFLLSENHSEPRFFARLRVARRNKVTNSREGTTASDFDWVTFLYFTSAWECITI
jgi:hypothetical protein